MATKAELELQLKQLKQEKARALELELLKRDELPHLYRFKDYKWSKQFLESKNKKLFLVAANQLGKSSTQIRKIITWATEPTLWAELWPVAPNLFWYLYPTSDVATYEFETKWVDLLPRGSRKDCPQYGWEVIKENKKVKGIRFNSGVLMLFKSYTQDVQHLQSGTVYYICSDEELPFVLWDELKFRLSASNGYFSMVFTATLGQQEWRETMEEIGTSKERFVGAEKIHASLYDSQFYTDGSPSRWTLPRIKEVEADCSNEQEVLKRVYGRFVLGAERKIVSYDPVKHNLPFYKFEYPNHWHIFAGIDYGSGGVTGHPAAITFTAVNTAYTKAFVVAAWRGDSKSRTDSGDILMRYREMKGELATKGFVNFYPAYYDYAQADLATIAEKLNEPLIKADKARDRGISVVDTLFKNDMLYLLIDEPHVNELASELITLKDTLVKKKVGDDLVDALRYSISLVPFDWASGVQIKTKFFEVPEAERKMDELTERRERGRREVTQSHRSIDEEFEEYNDNLGGY